MRRLLLSIAACAALLGVHRLAADQRAPGSTRANQTATKSIRIKTLSTRAERVSGGDVLVQVMWPGTRDVSAAPAGSIALNGRDVSSAFHRLESTNGLAAALTGLTVGRNTISVSGRAWGLPDATALVTNYPITGPIFSGPHAQPFICQTSDFAMPDGSTLGVPSGADCAAQTTVQYVYLPKGSAAFKPLMDRSRIPDDAATTQTTQGRSVPFVVRVETGVINRAIYQVVVLHDPTRDGPPTPFMPPAGWNRRFLAVHGSGCPGGWYIQGSVMGVSPLTGANVQRLGEGYAIFTSTLNHPSNSCNPVLAGETTMMVKERAIELLGVPEFTVSMGGSGGAYTSLQLADAYPGLFDGVLITQVFPDALSVAMAGSDGHLLTHYFAATNPAGLTEQQKIAVTGYASMRAFTDAANQAQRTDPIAGRVDVTGYSPAVWNAAVPAGLRYDAAANPKGARPTVFDEARNAYGTDPATGFARRPFDNVGVQYGLSALNAGVISIAQFLDLNERIGGFDQDANYSAARSVGDAGAIRRAYQAGLTLGGGGGLASIPVFDAGGYNDASAYHYQWFHFAVRDRLMGQNGDAGNHVMWRGPVQAAQAWPVFIEWVAAVAADRSAEAVHAKVVRLKPAAAVDGCWTTASEGAAAAFVKELQTFSSKPDTACNTAYPSYGAARLAAFGPINGNVLKCQLKPVRAADYPQPLAAPDLRRLRTIFKTGVCDWSKPGVGQVPVVPWASLGPAPDGLILEPRNR